MEGSELFRHAENWLKSNPGKNLRDYRKETGYSGPALKLRQGKGEPVRISYKGKSSESQVKRVQREKPKTEAEATYLRETKKEARRRSQSTLHQQTYQGRPSVAEHNVRLASGGTNEALSVSDPDFAAFKSEIEDKLPKGYIADVDDVTGGVRIIPENVYNKFDFPSKQPGITLELGDDINKSLSQLDVPNLKFSKGAVRFLSKVPMLGGVVAAGATLASGGSPAQAFGAAVEAENPIENLAAGPIFDESQDFGTVLEQARVQNQIPLSTRIENGALKILFPQQIRGRSGAKRAQEAL
jgi:hypothetical protein